MKITLAELAEITMGALKSVEAMGIESFELSEDYYWFIPNESLYDISTGEQPRDLNLGSLYDDFESAKKSYNEDDMIPYNLKQLSSIFRYISIKDGEMERKPDND